MTEPAQIDIEPTVRCNLKCPYCQHTFWRRSAEDMSFESFKTILDMIPGLQRIKLQGIGEPLLCKDLPLMIGESSRRKIDTFLYTNGTCLNDTTVHAIFENGLKEMCISCDHYDPEVLKILRPGLEFEHYRKGIKKALELSRQSGAKVQAWSLFTRPLANNFSQFIDFVKDLGFTHVTFQTSLTSWGSAVDISTFIPSDAEIASCMAEAKNKNSSEFCVDFSSTNNFDSTNPCLWPFYYSFISCDGYVQPCCIISDPGRFTLGNLKKKRFSNIWNSSEMIQFRRTIQTRRLHDFCKRCYGCTEKSGVGPT